MRTLLALVALAAGLQAQATNPNSYFIQATTTKLSIQQPADNALQVQGRFATVYCVAAQTATESWNGTAATATAGVIKKAPGTFVAPTVTAWTGSDVGSGTTGPVYNIPAGQTIVIALDSLRMGTTGTATNYSIATSGSCSILIGWMEFPQ